MFSSKLSSKQKMVAALKILFTFLKLNQSFLGHGIELEVPLDYRIDELFCVIRFLKGDKRSKQARIVQRANHLNNVG